ncbi:hypothetical protein TSOC_008326 [Tetrabaena socialis]|uniref:Uncharacterized protein n=1 Tax=Tetrabaena socialis TaxID=47790 RepID=A0A2J7ZYS5_9CHLO|nr:hypothetical protein TSOC_008326 [Tetrabaena socialis]|eukprot:PNH05420.1 hypothetical protein TSOC_008326 [Tetrabaena socialis]
MPLYVHPPGSRAPDESHLSPPKYKTMLPHRIGAAAAAAVAPLPRAVAAAVPGATAAPYSTSTSFVSGITICSYTRATRLRQN